MFPPLWAESQSATTPARYAGARGPIGDSSPAPEIIYTRASLFKICQQVPLRVLYCLKVQNSLTGQLPHLGFLLAQNMLPTPTMRAWYSLYRLTSVGRCLMKKPCISS